MTAIEPVGSQILSGASAPDPGVGGIGDYWFNTTNNYFYGPKTQETGWGAGVELGDQSFSALFDLEPPTSGDSIVYSSTTQLWEARKVRHTHSQDAASTLWTVTHNLGVKPGGITVVDSGDTVVYGNVAYTNLNTLTISFAAAFGGKAYIS